MGLSFERRICFVKNIRHFFLKLSDLFLTSEEACRCWKTDKQLLKIWHIFFYSALFGLMLSILPPQILDTQESPAAALWARLLTLIGLFIITLSFILFSFFYYKFVLKNNSKIYLSTLLFLYFGAIFFIWIDLL